MPRAAPPAEVEHLAQWARTRVVIVVALLMILAQLIWKAYLLHGLFFVQNDFQNLDLAIEHRLNWSYLTYISGGHLLIGLRLVAWLVVRTSLYNWGLASAVTVVFTAAASLACYRALRTVFGDNPRILIPLVFYLLTPLTIATFAWWSSAMESIPLQLAIFMALTSHVLYLRTARIKHLAAAGFWVAFGLIFSEKALVLPLLLFVLTAGFMVTRRHLLRGVRVALRHCWRVWLVYLVLMAGYAVVLAIALLSSGAQPQAPRSAGAFWTLIGDLLKGSFLPGAFGGPWQWFPVNSFVLNAARPSLEWLSVAAVVIVIAVSLLVHRKAWLAWATLAGWILVADVLPLAFGQAGTTSPAVLGVDLRYVADAAPVAAICVGLAFWPVAGVSSAPEPRLRQAKRVQDLRLAAAGLVAVFMFGSIWSVRELGSTLSGAAARSYIANAAEAVSLTSNGTNVYDYPVADSIVPPIFGRYSRASAVIGDLDIGKLHWLTKLNGTIDNLTWFGPDGKLDQVSVGPTPSVVRPKAKPCWPKRNGQVVVKFAAATSAYTSVLRFGYLLGPPNSAVISVRYGSSVKYLTVKPGLHSAFLPERGANVKQITIRGLGATTMCVGDAQAGYIMSNPLSTPIP